jgi:hypothetical protein
MAMISLQTITIFIVDIPQAPASVEIAYCPHFVLTLSVCSNIYPT